MNSRRAEFERIRRETEALWATAQIRPGIYGYQIRPGTRWNPGLSDGEIDAYERALGVRFPQSFRCMLSVMNGTDLPTVNVYGSSGLPHREWVGVYAYPRDLPMVRDYIGYVQEERVEVAEVLADQGFRLEPEAGLVPIYARRYLVCRAGAQDGPVLSIYGMDAILYGRTLAEYLRTEFLIPVVADEATRSQAGGG